MMHSSSFSKRLLYVLLGSDYSMLWVLIVLCVIFSLATVQEFSVKGRIAGEQLANRILALGGDDGWVVIAVHGGESEQLFIDTLQQKLADHRSHIETVVGPAQAAALFRRLESEGHTVQAVASTQEASRLLVFDRLRNGDWNIGSPTILVPESYRWPVFLKAENLRNVLQQNAAIAIVAIGMTMVIITGGIDLSVGSLIALSAVSTCLFIEHFGGSAASLLVMLAASLVGILLCGLSGMLTGSMITWLAIPPFIMTLSVMLMARGVAMLLTGGETVANLPREFTWLGTGASLANVPNSVVLMALLYLAAHVVLNHTVWGRHLYAVGGNREAARLSGVPVRSVVMTAYMVSGLMAGLGGVILASEQKAASPSYGDMYELYVIAAVVVGGTSLAGGRGKALGTLIGALIIGVVRNGMNIWNISGHRQTVVLGGIILLSVLLDQFRARSLRSQ